MAFVEPMTWRKPTDHNNNCYLCINWEEVIQEEKLICTMFKHSTCRATSAPLFRNTVPIAITFASTESDEKDNEEDSSPKPSISSDQDFDLI